MRLPASIDDTLSMHGVDLGNAIPDGRIATTCRDLCTKDGDANG